MKRSCLLLGLLWVLPVKAENWGAELKAELVHSIYQECNDKNSLSAKVADMIKVDKSKWCGCLISRITSQFEQNQLEQRLNQGNITLKQFEQEMGKMGEDMAEYCMNKLSK